MKKIKHTLKSFHKCFKCRRNIPLLQPFIGLRDIDKGIETYYCNECYSKLDKIKMNIK